MRDVRQTLLQRTSVRRYEREDIPEDTMEFIREAVRNTPTSYNGQQFTVIEIADQALKEKLYEITNQKQIKTCKRFLLFCADFHKMELLAKAKGVEMPPITDTMDGVLLGAIDASLAMMSAVVAAQASGLGNNCVGYIRTVDPGKIAEMMQLPKGVYVVCGLTLGIPREQPDLKPKQPQSLMFHPEHYRTDAEAMTRELEDYDRTVQAYNANRAGDTTTNDWCEHIIDYYRHVMDYRILAYLRAQGYDPQR